MDKKKQSLDATFFNKMYEQNQDPWNFESCEYEKEKYRKTLAVIPGEQYNKGFEIGCANGLLTSMLAERCAYLLAVDASSIAVRNAKKRMRPFPNVSIMEMEIPKEFPREKFDLMLLSEVGYFLTEEDLTIARDRMIDCLLTGAHLLLVHWTPPVSEFPLTGDEVHAMFLAMAGDRPENPLVHLKSITEPQYRMDLFMRK